MSHAEPDEARGALLGVDKEPVPPQWKKKVHLGQGRFRPKITRWGLCVASGIAILALLGASYFIYLRWDSLLPQRSKPPPNHPALPTSYLSDGSVIEVTNPDRGGLEVLLDPKAHRKREAGVRKYRWVVDQIIVAPDGVEKKVFSINGMS